MVRATLRWGSDLKELGPVAFKPEVWAVFGSLIIGLSRNPGEKQQMFIYAILGFALSEAVALFGLMMAFLILFAF